MFALTTDSMKSIGLGAIIVVIVVGVLATILVQKVIARVISLALTAIIGFGLYTQRASINDCVKKLREQAGQVTSGRVQDPMCKVFGINVKVPLDKLNPTKS